MNDKETLLAHTLRCCCHCFQPSVLVVLVAAVLAGIFTNVDFAAVAVFSILYKLKLCLLLLDVCAAQCAAATPQDNRRGTWSWTTGLHGSYSGNNRRDASTGETGEAGDGCGQGYVQTPRILHINCILKGLKLMPTAHTTAFL